MKKMRRMQIEQRKINKENAEEQKEEREWGKTVTTRKQLFHRQITTLRNQPNVKENKHTFTKTQTKDSEPTLPQLPTTKSY